MERKLVAFIKAEIKVFLEVVEEIEELGARAKKRVKTDLQLRL